MTRRNFFASSFAATATRLRAVAPGLMLGYDTYSIRAWDWKAPQHLEFAASLKLDAIQISSLGDFESLEPSYLAKIRDQARAANIVIDAGTGCICPSARAYRSKEEPAAHLRRGRLKLRRRLARPRCAAIWETPPTATTQRPSNST